MHVILCEIPYSQNFNIGKFLITSLEKPYNSAHIISKLELSIFVFLRMKILLGNT